jgi:hypothetical protein
MIGLVLAHKEQKILRDNIIFGNLSNLWPEEPLTAANKSILRI